MISVALIRQARHWVEKATCCALLVAATTVAAGTPSSWQFTDGTASAGAAAQFRYQFGYTETRDMMPGGVAAGDIDNDGDIDLIIPQGDYLPLKLLLNRGAGTLKVLPARMVCRSSAMSLPEPCSPISMAMVTST